MSALSIYRSVGANPLIGAILHGRVFFDPLPELVTFMNSNYPGKSIVDVGAGSGRMARMLAQAGFKVLAIDIVERENPEFQVHIFDATELDYPANSLPILARPCHGIFVDAVIEHILAQVPEMLYIGLPRNFDADLLDLPYRLECKPQVVGKEGEQIVIIRR